MEETVRETAALDRSIRVVRERWRSCALATILLVLPSLAGGTQPSDRPVFTIGIVWDGPVPEGERPALLTTRK